MTPLEVIWEALTELPTEDELGFVVRALVGKRAKQIRMMADYRSMAENGFEPGDTVAIDTQRGTIGPFKVARVGVRSVIVDLGMRRPVKSGSKTLEPALSGFQARHVHLTDKLIKEARRAYRKVHG